MTRFQISRFITCVSSSRKSNTKTDTTSILCLWATRKTALPITLHTPNLNLTLFPKPQRYLPMVEPKSQDIHTMSLPVCLRPWCRTKITSSARTCSAQTQKPMTSTICVSLNQNSTLSTISKKQRLCMNVGTEKARRSIQCLSETLVQDQKLSPEELCLDCTTSISYLLINTTQLRESRSDNFNRFQNRCDDCHVWRSQKDNHGRRMDCLRLAPEAGIKRWNDNDHVLACLRARCRTKNTHREEGMSGVISYLFLTPVHCNLESLDRIKSSILKTPVMVHMCGDFEISIPHLPISKRTAVQNYGPLAVRSRDWYKYCSSSFSFVFSIIYCGKRLGPKRTTANYMAPVCLLGLCKITVI
jgi:hypothetical protein